jgi:hypothetical protein
MDPGSTATLTHFTAPGGAVPESALGPSARRDERPRVLARGSSGAGDGRSPGRAAKTMLG